MAELRSVLGGSKLDVSHMFRSFSLTQSSSRSWRGEKAAVKMPPLLQTILEFYGILLQKSQSPLPPPERDGESVYDDASVEVKSCVQLSDAPESVLKKIHFGSSSSWQKHALKFIETEIVRLRYNSLSPLRLLHAQQRWNVRGQGSDPPAKE